jgi:hypothetical protein
LQDGTEYLAVPIEPWLERFREADGWREGLALGYEIAKLPPDDALAVMRHIYRSIPSIEHRQQILKPFVFHGGHVHAIEVLHLAATDPELAVQGWAFGYLRDWAFQDFSDDYEGYLAWRDRFGGVPLPELLERNAQELVQRLGALQGEELMAELRALEDLDLGKGDAAEIDLARVARDAGLLEVVRALISSEDAEARQIAAGWLSELEPDQHWMQREVAPLLRAGVEHDDEVIGGACKALGAEGQGWAVEPLIDSLRWAQADENGFVFEHAQALARIGDARAIPALIALIAADDSKQSVYGIGYYALEPLTGVRYDESHDGAFWRAWWLENRERLGPELQGLELPEIGFHQ